MAEFDEVFVQAPEHRANPDPVVADGIPTIDLSAALPLDALSEPISPLVQALIAEIGAACEQWGFFEVVNHGVPAGVREKVEKVGKMFFKLPMDEKRKVRRDEANVWGYYDTEHTKNVRDWKEVFDFSLLSPSPLPEPQGQGDGDKVVLLPNRWPESVPGFKEACAAYTREMEKLGLKLLALIALSLGLPLDRLYPLFDEQLTFIRMNYYRPCPKPDLVLGLGRHKDMGAVTILAQDDDVGGLEVRRKTHGEWVFVNPTPDAYVINVGDVVQVWTNERYESVEHRVRVNKERERFSIPYFMSPAHYVDVQPLPELVTADDPPKYRDYRWGRFFSSRKFTNFKKRNIENLQIHHFKLPLPSKGA